MSDSLPRLAVTAATGALGRLVVERLLAMTSASRIVAAVRRPDAASAFASRGVEVRLADYTRPETLLAAFEGVGRLLMISSNAIGERAPQHRNVIAAAKRAGVGQILYTSLLHADRSPLALAAEHLETERDIRASGIPFVLLRNGWYTENYTASIPPALAHGALLGSAGDGLISSAARADYAAAAAAALLTEQDWSGRVFELAGDEAYVMTEFAAEISRSSGRPVAYRNLPQAAFRDALVGAGLPPPVASLLSESDAEAAKGALFDDSHQLSAMIGYPTTPMKDSVKMAVAALDRK